MESKNVAIYLDFENLAISAHEVYRGEKLPLAVEPILKYAEKKGTIRIKKAYADWSIKKFSQYQGTLISFGFELIHLPETNRQGKNGSDMRLVIDVMDQLTQTAQIDTVLIGSGDSDFIPLTQYMLHKEKEVVVIGFEHSVSNVMKSFCTEFRSLESILGKPVAANGSRASRSDPGRKLLIAFLDKRKEEGPIRLLDLKQALLKQDKKFDEKEQGHKSFKKFVKHWIGDLVEKVEKANGKGSKGKKGNTMVYFKPFRKRSTTPSTVTPPKSTRTPHPSKEKTSTPPPERKPATRRPADKAKKPVSRKVDRKNTPEYKKARDLVIRFVKERESNDPIALTRIKQQLLKLDSSFSEKEIGFRYFKHFINELEGDLIEKLELRGKTTYAIFKDSKENKTVESPKAPQPKSERTERRERAEQRPEPPKEKTNQKEPRQRDSNKNSNRNTRNPANNTRSGSRDPKASSPAKTVKEPAKKTTITDKDRAKTLLAKELFYNKNLKDRLQMAKSLMEGFKTFPIMTMEQMVTYIRERSNVKATDIFFRKYVFTLKHGSAFQPSSGDTGLAGKLLKLKTTIKSEEELDGIYIEQVSQVLRERFSKLKTHEILEVLF